MESKSFVKLLRKVIREEVRAAVRTEIKSVLNEDTSVTKHESNLQNIVDNTKTFKPKAKKKFAKNSMINDLLNETANTVPSQEQMDWSKMNYKSSMAESFGAERQQENYAAPLTTTGINGEAINMNNEGVAASVNAMTKDYSALMKAIAKKKGK